MSGLAALHEDKSNLYDEMLTKTSRDWRSQAVRCQDQQSTTDGQKS